VSLLLVGLNHRTAPVELREQLSLAGCALRMALEELIQVEGIAEAVILSTCNRLELYAAADGAGVWARIETFLARFQNVPPETLRPHLYFLEGEAAVEHLMRVAAGLDSMVLGEPQILGQVATAYSEAQEARASGTLLSHLFNQAIHAGKRARAETDISRYTTSVSHMAVSLIREHIGNLNTCRLLVIGVGEMAESAAQTLIHEGARDVTFINRTYSRAEALAAQYGGRALSWYSLNDALAWADVVISATGAPHTVIYAADIERVLPQREGRPLLLVDIAVPRDVEVGVETLPGITRRDIDALQSAVDSNLAQRQAAVPQVERIIAQERAAFTDWLYSRQVVHVIANLQQWARALADAEVAQAINRLPQADAHTEQVMQKMAHRLVNKLLHQPTIRLKGHAAEGNGWGYAHAVRDLFALETETAPVCAGESDACERGDGVTTCNLQCIATGK
jgi:glutamyl-tRNA reductase